MIKTDEGTKGLSFYGQGYLFCKIRVKLKKLAAISRGKQASGSDFWDSGESGAGWRKWDERRVREGEGKSLKKID